TTKASMASIAEQPISWPVDKVDTGLPWPHRKPGMQEALGTLQPEGPPVATHEHHVAAEATGCQPAAGIAETAVPGPPHTHPKCRRIIDPVAESGAQNRQVLQCQFGAKIMVLERHALGEGQLAELGKGQSDVAGRIRFEPGRSFDGL